MTTDLEALIDREGIDAVLTAIREICYAKASHIAVREQNVALAKAWIAKALKINSAAQGVRL